MPGKITLVEFGSLNHVYPVLEIYSDNELIFEVITKEDLSLDVLEAEHDSRMLSLNEVKEIMELCLPAWKAAIGRSSSAKM